MVLTVPMPGIPPWLCVTIAMPSVGKLPATVQSIALLAVICEVRLNHCVANLAPKKLGVSGKGTKTWARPPVMGMAGKRSGPQVVRLCRALSSERNVSLPRRED